MSKLKVLLHIGRQKTGTSSIQNALFKNKAYLNDKGFHYPDSGKFVNHNSFLEFLRPVNVKEKNIDGVAAKKLCAPLFDGLQKDCINIVSAEVLHNAKPEMVMAVFEECEVEVISYIRNEIDFVASAYNQRVHATGYAQDVESFVQTVGVRSSNGPFLDKWKKVFGDDFSARIFQKTELKNGDVVDDFFSAALKIEAPKGLAAKKSNPSLSSSVLAMKLQLNRDQDTYSRFFDNPKLYRALGVLAERHPGQFKLPKSVRNLLVDKFKNEQADWSKRYFSKDSIFDYDDVEFVDGTYAISKLEFDKLCIELAGILKN